MESNALLSQDQKHRYTLTRKWEDLFDNKTCVFIGLNPSTADASNDDPTIRRCINFAKSFGCNELMMLNLFSYRSTDPKVLKDLKEEELIDSVNNNCLLRYCQNPNCIVIAAWGNHGELLGRDLKVISMLEAHDIKLNCLGLTKSGNPKHPLYLPKDSELIPFSKFYL